MQKITEEGKKRGRKPLFLLPEFLIGKMIQESTVRALIDQTIEGTEIFLVDLKIGPGNKINVLVDAIGGLPISDCIKVSRGIEHNLDRESEDFELNVSSPGLDKPLKVFRQYEKNIGRSLHITFTDDSVVDAIIQEVNEPGISLEIEEVVTPSETWTWEKGKITTVTQDKIKEAKINISFK